ncbi:teichoic acid biosynthesis protein A [Photobacterium damselae subsp. damselae]|uniref:WecB/TagA/CpsF family glycosyltransferase n=1 Tax=Photobacterium damselae TaxID=38293 RepID=UPI000D04EBCD|nr:WecB/TagA/CpsF family glycosyltransferase [Photobacterium damselae]PSB87042.1 teichoic acid biosynthesis protein A [Photobacterium damselae subsp. damselae]
MIDKCISNTPRFKDLLGKIELGDHKYISFVNPFSYPVLENNNELLSTFDYLYVDGISLVKLHNFFYHDNIFRYSFDYSSIAGLVFEFAIKNNMKVALIGGTETEIIKSKINILNKYKELNISFSRNGFFNSSESRYECFKKLDEVDFDILIVGMGSPLQEKFLCEYKKYSSKKITAFTCGGFISQTSINSEYYHPIIKKTGLRWLQRAVMHKHVRNRLFNDYPKFFWKYILTKGKK